MILLEDWTVTALEEIACAFIVKGEINNGFNYCAVSTCVQAISLKTEREILGKT